MGGDSIRHMSSSTVSEVAKRSRAEQTESVAARVVNERRSSRVREGSVWRWIPITRQYSS